jgi:hypothetical protein
MKTNNKGKKNKALRVIIATAAALATGAGAVCLFLKRKRHFTAFTLTTAVIFSCMLMCGMTAYAYSDEGAETEISLETEPDEVIIGEDLEIDLSETYDPEQPPKLTPPGNLTLVDDLSGEQSESKQFITVITKSGNYFYIIIDRAGDKENVHFLNLVDEADLLAILEAEKDPNAPPAPVVPEPEQPTTTPDPTPETPKSNNTTGLLVMTLIIAAAGGGAFYYFKVFKPKQGAKKSAGTTELDEFSFDADEDDLFTDSADEQDSGGDYDGDTDEDIPDFTAADDNESEGE